MAGYPCCCGGLSCETPLTVTASGMTDADCAECDPIYNTSYLAVGTDFGDTRCDGTASESHLCRWSFAIAMDAIAPAACDPSPIQTAYVSMFEIGGQKYIKVFIREDTDDDVIEWVEEIDEYELPQTITSASLCPFTDSGSYCDWTNTAWLIEA
jgi:hypothetical protein